MPGFDTLVTVVDEKAWLPAAEDLARLARLSMDLLAIACPDGRIEWVSPSVKQVLGRAPEDVVESPFYDLIHPDDLAVTREEIAGLADGKAVVRFRNRYRHADGSYVWMEWNGAPIENGRLYAIGRDITEQVESVAAMERQTQNLLLGESVAHIGHWSVDLRTQALYWSPEVFRIHGLDPESFSPTVPAAIDRYHPVDRARVAEHIERAVAERSGFDFQLRILRPDGEQRQVVAKGRVQIRDGEAVSLFGIFQDVTEQIAMQERLLTTERMASIGTLAAGIGHEINNPLTYVMANLDLLAEVLGEAAADADAVRARAFGFAEAAQHGAMRVRKIVRNLKSFARPSEANTRPLVLRSVVESAVAMAGHELRHRARIELDFDPDVDMVLGDEARLGQVFVNLIVNAVHAIEEAHVEDGLICVRARREGDGVRVDVADNGTGLEPGAMARLFEPFFTTKPEGVGTGLGLSISQRIVEDLGGEITVSSTPGEGATFRVWLPAHVGVPGPAAPEHTPALGVALPRPRVLVVDDEPFIRHVAQQVLGRDFDVEVLSSARETLSALEHDRDRDALIIDVMMPGFTGVELYRMMERRWPELADRVLFVTGGAFTPDARRFMDELDARGKIYVLEKPFEVGELRRAVAQTVARARGGAAVAIDLE